MHTLIAVLYLAAVVLLAVAGVVERSLPLIAAACALLAFSLPAIQSGLQ